MNISQEYYENALSECVYYRAEIDRLEKELTLSKEQFEKERHVLPWYSDRVDYHEKNETKMIDKLIYTVLYNKTDIKDLQK